MPAEVKKSGPGGDSTFCDFYQFSWQTYLYLMHQDSSGAHRFQSGDYPLLEFDSKGIPVDSCDQEITGQTLKISLDPGVHGAAMGIHQAGDAAVIYAQDKNVVYYDVRFDKPTCGLSGSAVEMAKSGVVNFPGGTTELKFAWKVIDPSEAGGFVTQKQVIDGEPKTLGLVGMHVAVATPDHPEFVWATFERDGNSPNCAYNDAPDGGWAFASPECSGRLPDSAKTSDSCDFNKSSNEDGPTGNSTNICRVYPDGTADGDLDAAENRAVIHQLNKEVRKMLEESKNEDMQVLANYFNVGAIWVSDIVEGSDVSNQRGSLRLANTIAETTYQHVDLSGDFVSNCFGCHEYRGAGEHGNNNNIVSLVLSHVFADILHGQGKAIDVQSQSRIWSDHDASGTCGGSKGVCKSAESFLTWNGDWTNINGMSVCGCK